MENSSTDPASFVHLLYLVPASKSEKECRDVDRCSVDIFHPSEDGIMINVEVLVLTITVVASTSLSTCPKCRPAELGLPIRRTIWLQAKSLVVAIILADSTDVGEPQA